MDRALVSALVAFVVLFALGVTSVLVLGRAHEARMRAVSYTHLTLPTKA